jgi:ubiquinone biosynthesis protein UbiJ
MPSPASPLDSLKPLAGRALEIALNRLLALDPETRIALAKLDGRRIELALVSNSRMAGQAPALALSITVKGDRLEVGPPDASSEPDLGLRATLGGLLSQLPFARSANSPPVGKLRINGDADLARTLQQLAQRFDPDWDKPFADVFGAILGPQIARVLREGLRSGRRVAENLARDAAEFVTEESRDVVGKTELAAFHDDVDVLRDRAERLVARVSRLRSRDGESA